MACLTAGLALTLLFNSCSGGPDKEDGVWIPVPKDTSALGRINHFIPKEDIDSWTKSYVVEREIIQKNVPDLYIPISEAFNKEGLINILKDPKSVGIKIYYGIKKGDKQQELRMILVGVDEQGKDLYYTEGSKAAAQGGGGGRGGSEYGQCIPPCGD